MTRDQIVIVTNQDDAHADEVIRALWRIGGEPIRLNTDEIPQYTTMSFFIDPHVRGSIAIEANGLVIDFERIRSVWWRRPSAFYFPDGLSAWEREFAQQELHHAIRGGLSAVAPYWMSHPDAIRRASWKLDQLHRAQRLGFVIPRTLVTSDPAQALQFYDACGGDIVFKAMAGAYLGAEKLVVREPDAAAVPLRLLTTRVGREQLEHIDTIRIAPALFQERVPKLSELRVTIVEGEVFAAEIVSQEGATSSADYRSDFEAVHYRPFGLAPEIADRCVRFVEGYGLAYSAMDLILTPGGQVVFLESNPNGQFRFIEDSVPELRITEAIATCLLRGADV